MIFRLAGMPQWRRNQIAITSSAAFIFFGYTLVIGFLPIFVRQLGIESTRGIAFWSGLILSSSPLLSSVTAPVWGRIGDRYGMKVMAQRATAFNAILWFTMGFSRNVWDLLIIRSILGVLGGFNSVSVALITQEAPKKEVPQIIGTLQAVQILSAAIGPLFGGVLADLIGVRSTFFVTGIVMAGSVASVMVFYENIERQSLRTLAGHETKKRAQFWRRPEYFTTMMILFFVNMADRTFGPILPLFLEELGTPAGRLAVVSGALISGAAFGEAFSAWVSGKLATRVSLRQLISWRLVLSVLVLAPMVAVHSAIQFSVLRVLLALLAGGTLTLALSAASHVIPDEHRGTGYALLSSTSTLGGAVGPFVAGVLGGFDIRSVFVFNAVVYLLMFVFVYRNVRH